MLNKILNILLSFVLLTVPLTNKEYTVYLTKDDGFEYEIVNKKGETIIPQKIDNQQIKYKLLDDEYILINTKVPKGYQIEENKKIDPKISNIEIRHKQNKNLKEDKKYSYLKILNLFVLILMLGYLLMTNIQKEVLEETSLSF